MTINCLPINGKIDKGFYCELDSVEVFDAGGQNIYVDKTWSGAEVFLSYFFFLFVVLILTKWIFDFFLPKIIRIRKK